MTWEVALLAASTGMSVMGQISAGREKQRQEAIRQRQLAHEAQLDRIKSIEEETALARRTGATRARNIALAAAKGFDIGASGSFLALEEDVAQQEAMELANIKLFGASQSAQTAGSILASKSAAKAAKTEAITGSLSTLFSGGAQIYKGKP